MFTKIITKCFYSLLLPYCDWLLRMKNANNLGEWSKGKNDSWPERMTGEQPSPSSPDKFVAGLGTNAVGEEGRERGSSNCECFASSAENTDEKWQTCSWGCCSSWRMCWRCCATSSVPQRCESSAVSFPQPRGNACRGNEGENLFGQIQLAQMNLDDAHIPNGSIIWKAIIW